jgi:hypothetical protein
MIWSDYLEEEDLEFLILKAIGKPIAWQILEETLQNKQKQKADSPMIHYD